MLIHHQDQGSQPGSHSQAVAELAYSQVQDTEPAAIPSSSQKACGPVDRLSAFRVQSDVPGTIPAPAPSPTPGASNSGFLETLWGKMQASGGGLGQEGGRSLLSFPQEHTGVTG